jgi:aryl-alcohol dehydrogenase-like predicted oxidoreductase
MDYRYLGNTGIKVSTVCFGNMTFGADKFGEGHVGQKTANEMVARCIDAGVNFFDTADVYGNGEAEEILGAALGSGRKDIILATKIRGRTGPGVNEVGLSRHHILSGCDVSLRRLNTDYIDLYQVHGWDASTPLEETMRALDDLVRWGKVRYIGFSNFSGWQAMKALAISGNAGIARFVSAQMQYSLICRGIEREIVPLCDSEGISILPWSPLGGGLLSGKYTQEQWPKDARHSDRRPSVVPLDENALFATVDALAEIAKTRDVTPSQVALNWLLSKPVVASVIIGARTMEQLEDNLMAAEWTLGGDEQDALDKVSDFDQGYPYTMIAAFQRNR